MIIEIIRCDKCGEAINGDNPANRYTGPYCVIDLCKKCNELFLEWLDAAHIMEGVG